MTDRGTALVAAGLAVLAVGLGVSAAASGGVGPEPGPSPGTATPTAAGVTGIGDGRSGTVIGVQGAGSYTQGGYVEYVVNGTSQWRFGEANAYFDVTPLSDGRVVAAYMEEDPADCGNLSSCARTGFVVLDPTGDEVTVDQRFSFPVRSSTNSEVHDVEPLPDGGFLLTDMDAERLLIVRDGEITWEWEAANFYTAPPDPTRRDWLHINDVDRLSEGRYLVSVRNANQLLVIERNETGGSVARVINRDRTADDDGSCISGTRLYDADGDGDVRCGDPEVIDKQHNPQWLADDAVLVADSENDRVVELHQTDDKWEPAWILTGTGDRGFQWPRDADRLANGNTLVTDSRGRRVVEVTESGELVGAYSTGNGIVYEADSRARGERVGAQLYGDGRETVTRPDTGSELPVFGELAGLARAAAPWLPLWIRGPQVAVVLLSLALVGSGLVVRRR